MRARTTVATAAAALVVLGAHRRRRREQLRFMPKGINDSRGVTMASSIRAASPAPAGR